MMTKLPPHPALPAGHAYRKAGRHLTTSPVVKDFLLSMLSAVLLALSFPSFNLEFLAWAGFVPLFFAIANKSKIQAFLLAYLTGVIFWFATVYWLIHVTLPGLILLVLYLALYFGLFGLLFSTSYILPTTYYLFFIPSAWILLEYCRSYFLTGFGWALLGYSQYLNLPIIQIADITGVYGVSFLVMMANVLIYRALRFALCALRGKEESAFSFTNYLLPILLLVLSLGYGFYNLRPAPRAQRPALKVSVIQGNIPQALKWQAYSQGFILDRYTVLTKEAARENPDLIIWPEAAAPGFLFHSPDTWIFQDIFALAQRLKTNLLIGTVVKDNAAYLNSAVLVDAFGNICQRYDKLHLVPFGEYIPLRKIFRFLQAVVPIGDFSPGKDYTVFKIPNHKSQAPNRFSVLICFEDLFPELSRRFVKKGAGFLVNITNDAWFGRTCSPFQHLSLSVLRAVENRRPLIRAANTGVSCFIASTGQVQSCVSDIFVTATLTGSLRGRKDVSFYTRYGDLFVLLCLILVIYGIIIKIATPRSA